MIRQERVFVCCLVSSLILPDLPQIFHYKILEENSAIFYNQKCLSVRLENTEISDVIRKSPFNIPGSEVSQSCLHF